ncbi:Shikimate dehydrogenase [Magnetospirillum gryphiswaldense MSR-1 v2]|uniref:Shikimate dehydrogenase (NADP(+)) n=1 Tax=Magnetospirillum gryphiswaldense (strain DSM 6361 / JCM 21280 / NBRC 15271 / MSR-1) TaxID=431944 RepID=V6F4S6_MAGGM|nr:shikimate dehydrogenase [Magnetospirillum gryphiswaldense]CDL00525.1 Shikimate dehydrogenase [Magnetospirillum gryphiswaldense MSR-1 v2]
MILSGKARLAGVLGWPVGHSRSPRLHGYWLDRLGIDGAYVPLPVRPEDFASVFRALPKMGFAGANVTVPHKEQALILADEVEPLAKRIGAVNTLVVREDGSILGLNTDAFGFMQNLLETHPASLGTLNRPAVVLGAGGAARAVIAALVDAGVPEIRLVNRSLERAEKLAADIGGPIRVQQWDRLDLAGAGLLVNTTSLGMSGQPPLDIDLSALPQDAVVNDIVYVPLLTDLLLRAQARGNPVVDGLGMLLWQAVRGFSLWFGQQPEVTADLRDFVLKS